MGILAGHAPMVTMLRPGIVTIFRGSAREPVVVTGGFAEVGPSGLTILADRAVARADFDTAMLAAEIKDAEEDLTDATEPNIRDKAQTRLDQLRQVQSALNL